MKYDKEFELNPFLEKCYRYGASDIHLREDSPACIRKAGKIVEVEGLKITREHLMGIIETIDSQYLKENWKTLTDFDFSYELKEQARFRLNFLKTFGKIGFSIRILPFEIPSLKDLKLPTMIHQFTNFDHGIVFVTGPTGSGKSTTIASLLDHINQRHKKHIVTLEDPIEYYFTPKESIFTQRQLGSDTMSFADGVKYALRQDPDIILLGEMRDRETFSNALKAAETGHLVFSTLHTTDAVQTINRIVNFFEPHEREQIRRQLVEVLRGTIAQKLITTKDGKSVAPAVEVLSMSLSVRDYVLKNDMEKIYDLLRSGSIGKEMMTMNSSLYNLIKADIITEEEGLKKSPVRPELEKMLRGAYSGNRAF